MSNVEPIEGEEPAERDPDRHENPEDNVTGAHRPNEFGDLEPPDNKAGYPLPSVELEGTEPIVEDEPDPDDEGETTEEVEEEETTEVEDGNESK